MNGDIGGLSQGGLITLMLSALASVFVMTAQRLVAPVMSVVVLYAAVSAYFTPGGLVDNGGGGEAGVAWGLELVIVASVMAICVAVRATRRGAVTSV